MESNEANFRFELLLSIKNIEKAMQNVGNNELKHSKSIRG
jgi:hypothetical protein